MNAEQLLAHFDRISDAPDAVPRLRKFILDLAIRGKLVEQDDNDAPAPETLPLIERSRKTAGKATPAAVDPNDVPYKTPLTWKWVRLGETMAMINGRAFKPTDWLPSGLPIVRIQNLNNPKAPFNYSDEASIEERHIIDSGCFLISWSGTPGTSFGAFIWQRGRAALNQHIFKCLLVEGLFFDRFLQLAINGRLDEMISKAHGGVGLQHITKGKLENLLLSLPPLAEQHRIVAKVDELMGLCDRLEAAQQEREACRTRLTAASLARLSQPADAPQFRDHVRFHLQHFPRFTTRPDQIPHLRQAILNLAVRGKLAHQDPNDSPSPNFVISEESLTNDRLCIDLPGGWSWARVGDVAESRLGKMLDRAKNSGRPYKYLRNTNVHWFDIRTDELKTMPIEEREVENFLLKNGDVLICEGGHGIGRTAVWRQSRGEFVFQKALHRVRPGPKLHSDFLAACMSVYFHSGILQTYFTGVGIPHFTGVALAKLVFPLPPIAEQRRIVAKVEKLMAVCDQLESQLTTTQTESRRLLEATLYQALAPALETTV